ncbi:GntR family transcriptional regulator [Georgenia ruanii]|nr:GntR family transcriptional regulator [Georgenia ruanii]
MPQLATRGNALDRESSDPLWMQLMHSLRDRITNGQYVADQALPSEAELSEIYGVSRTVVREALAELVQERLIYKIKGKGAFVAPDRAEVRFVGSVTGSAADLLASGRRVMTTVLDQGGGPASPEEAMALNLGQDEPVVRLRRLRVVDGVPWLLVRTALPEQYVPGLDRAKLENRSLYETLRRRYGIEAAGADRWLEAVIPTAEEANLLEVEPGTPLLGIESVAWDKDGNRFEWYYALHRSDQSRFYVGIR